MADPRVVIVTGSRTWRWQRQLYGVLDQIAAEVGRDQIVIRHGNNPAGADWWAHMWCMDPACGQSRKTRCPPTGGSTAGRRA